MYRRSFLGGLGGFAASAALAGQAALASSGPKRMAQPRFMWAYLAQFGMKLWEQNVSSAELRLDESMWREMADRLAAARANVIVFDLAEGMVFPSHPELAVKGSWEPERVRTEIARLKRMGLMSVPKLNFSTSHDQWLGPYRPYLSTPKYFEVCADVIGDVAAVFDESPLFHLGYDEENYYIQDVNKFEHVRLRRGDLWWHDFLWFVRQVECRGMRPWIWSDYCWEHKDEFLKRMPKTVLQTNWYYGPEFDLKKISEKQKPELDTYNTLEKACYDQVPCGSTYFHAENFGMTVEYCRSRIDSSRLKGYFMAPWYGPVVEQSRAQIVKSIDTLGAEAMRWKDVQA